MKLKTLRGLTIAAVLGGGALGFVTTSGGVTSATTGGGDTCYEQIDVEQFTFKRDFTVEEPVVKYQKQTQTTDANGRVSDWTNYGDLRENDGGSGQLDDHTAFRHVPVESGTHSVEKWEMTDWTTVQPAGDGWFETGRRTVQVNGPEVPCHPPVVTTTEPPAPTTQPDHKGWICHATSGNGQLKNGYNLIEVDLSAFPAHEAHVKDNSKFGILHDIVPAPGGAASDCGGTPPPPTDPPVTDPPPTTEPPLPPHKDDIVHTGDIECGDTTVEITTTVFTYELDDDGVTWNETATDTVTTRQVTVEEFVHCPTTTVPTTDPPVTDPPATDPPVTDPPVVTTPVTDPPVITTPTTLIPPIPEKPTRDSETRREDIGKPNCGDTTTQVRITTTSYTYTYDEPTNTWVETPVVKVHTVTENLLASEIVACPGKATPDAGDPSDGRILAATGSDGDRQALMIRIGFWTIAAGLAAYGATMIGKGRDEDLVWAGPSPEDLVG